MPCHHLTTGCILQSKLRLTDPNAGIANSPSKFKHDAEKKIFWAQRFAVGMELVRSMIDHKKVLVLALNGPAVGAGAAWFQGVCDLFYAAEGAWLQVTFSQLGLVPENGSAVNWAQHMGIHRANDWLLFGGKASVEELQTLGLVNQVFPKEGFQEKVHSYLKEMLKDRDGKSMMEMKRLQNKASRDARILALFEAWQALSERFVEGEPLRRMTAKMEELAGEFRSTSLSQHRELWLMIIQQSEKAESRRCRISSQCSNLSCVLIHTYL